MTGQTVIEGLVSYLSLFDVPQGFHVECGVVVRKRHLSIRVTTMIACSG